MKLLKPKKTICITGSLGLVGSEAVQFFLNKDWNVIGVDNNMRSEFFGVEKTSNASTLNIDIRDEEVINKLFQEYKFDAILNCAAQPSHDWSKDNALIDFKTNALGTLILLEATRKYCPDAVFVHISTDKVYGENFKVDNLIEGPTRYDTHYGRGTLGEEVRLDNAGNRSLFGCSKTAADIYVQEYGNYFGMKTVCFRCGCITGKNHKGAELHGFMAYLVKCIKEGKTYNIFGYKGKQVRDQIHVYDLITACYHFIKHPQSGAVYNMGGRRDRSVSILEAIDLVEEATGKKAVVSYIDEPRRGDRIWDIHCVDKFKKDYPLWDYRFSLQDIIKDLCQNRNE